MTLIDPNYILHSNCLDFQKLTAIHASSEEIATWVDRGNYSRTEGFRQLQQQREQEERRVLQSQGATSSGNNHASDSIISNLIRKSSSDERQTRYSFVTECFFMTARILNLGLLRALSDYKGLMHDLSRSKDALATLEAQRGSGAPPQLEQDIANAKTEIDRLSQQRLCYEAQILRDVPLLQQALSFYRLLLILLVNLVGGCGIPLPAEYPIDAIIPPPTLQVSLGRHYVNSHTLSDV